MRVIAGRAKGTRLKVPPRLTRPSTDRLREALFSILGSRVDGAEVLDLFAGSGALGLEALSRGAARATFVESNWNAGKVIGENLAKAGFERAGSVVERDVFDVLATSSQVFDLIFADPPYASNAPEDLAGKLMANEQLPERLGPEGLVVLEVETEREAPAAPSWELLDRRNYGSSAILFYALKEGA